MNDRATEYKITIAFSKTIIDEVLSAGVGTESSYSVERDKSTRAVREREILVGPSLQFRPVKRAHLDLEPLWGVTGESKRFKMWIVFGWDF